MNVVLVFERHPLTLAQWLPKPATSQLPIKRRLLRKKWSPKGAREYALGSGSGLGWFDGVTGSSVFSEVGGMWREVEQDGVHFCEEGVFGIAFVVGFDLAGEEKFGVAGVGFDDGTWKGARG